MGNKHRVLIAEDQHLSRSGLCFMVSAIQDCNVVGEAKDGLEAFRLATTLMPDVMLIDLSLSGINGFEVTTAIKRRVPRMRVIALAARHSDDYFHEAIIAGADAYVAKDGSFEDLVVALRRVTEGKKHLDQRRISACARDTLSGRERIVLKLVAEGHTNRQVGEYLKLSPKTIEKFRANLMHKLGITNLTALVRIAIDMGVVSFPGYQNDKLTEVPPEIRTGR